MAEIVNEKIVDAEEIEHEKIVEEEEEEEEEDDSDFEA